MVRLWSLKYQPVSAMGLNDSRSMVYSWLGGILERADHSAAWVGLISLDDGSSVISTVMMIELSLGISLTKSWRYDRTDTVQNLKFYFLFFYKFISYVLYVIKKKDFISSICMGVRVGGICNNKYSRIAGAGVSKFKKIIWLLFLY